MAKSLATLIKLRRRELDALRQSLAVLYTQREECDRLILALENELANEMRAAEQHADISQFFGGFAGRIKNRRLEVEATIVQLENTIAQVRDAMAERFSELKKLEIAEANRIAEEKRAIAEREQKGLDEVGLVIFERRRNSEE